MGNPRDKTYTERVSVAVTGAQREGLRAYARAHTTGIAVVMREAALEAIGRQDLSVADKTEFPVGENLERKPASRRTTGHQVRIIVNVTRAQRLALELAAELGAVPLSALIRDAALTKAKVPAAKLKPGRPGRPIGVRSRQRSR